MRSDAAGIMTAPRARLFLLAGLSAALLAATAGTGRTDAAPGSRTVSVSPADLRPASQADGRLDWVGSPREFYYTNVDFENRYDRDNYAPLFLPHGARVKSLVVHYMDRGCSVIQDIRAALLRQNPATGEVRKLAEVSSQGLPIDPSRATLETAAIGHPVVNNSAFTYALFVRFNNVKRDRVRFHGATIEYE